MKEWLSKNIVQVVILIVSILVLFSLLTKKIQIITEDDTLQKLHDSIFALNIDYLVLEHEKDSIKVCIDSIEKVLKNENKKVITIIKYYDTLRDSINGFSLDESVRFFSSHISKTDTLWGE